MDFSPFLYYILGGVEIYNKRHVIIFLVLFSVLFNFIFIPQQVQAVALTLAGLGVAYELAEAIYLFVLGSAAVGVTYKTWQEARKAYDMYEGTSPAPIYYPDFRPKADEVEQAKKDLALDYWYKQWDLQVLPGGLPDPDPNSNKRGILGLLGGIGIMGGFINNYLSLFQTLELQEGNNTLITESDVQHFNGYNVTLIRNEHSNGTVTYDVMTNGTIHALIESFNINYNNSYIVVTNVEYYSVDKVRLYYTIIYPGYDLPNKFNNKIVMVGKDNHYQPPYLDGDTFNIDVLPDSPILDYGPYNRKPPQPNLIPIRRLKPEIKPDGSKQYIYENGIDGLIEEIVLNTPIDEIINPDGEPYKIRPGKGNEVIIEPDLDPTTPFPQPKPPTRPEIWPPKTPDPDKWPSEIPFPPWPQPDPDTWPDTYPYPIKPTPWPPETPTPWPDPDKWPDSIPYPYPDPDTWPDNIPYPWPQPEPNPNPSPQTPVEPGKQIDYTSWLQIIINWLKRIWEKIPILSDEQPGQEDPLDPEVPGIDFAPLQDISLTNKFPFSLPWDIKASIDLLVAEPEAPRWVVPIVSEEIVIDLGEFEELALIARSFLSIIYVIMLIILTRRFIGGS